MDPVTAALVHEFSADQDLDYLGEDKQFEHFAAYSVISSRHDEEITTDDLVVGDGGDLGIDAYAILVNGRLISDEEEVAELLTLNGYLDVEFIFVQAKRSPKFDGGSILTFCENIREVIFLGGDRPCNDDVKRIIKLVNTIYQAAAKLKGNPECRLYYVTTGFWQDDAYLRSIINQQVGDFEKTNRFKSVRFIPLGAQQIQDLYRQTKRSISREIQFDKFVTLPQIGTVRAAYLGVIPATEYLRLITDDEENIIRSIFIDNIRDFQGDNRVNVEIASTIQPGLLDQFVLRNNGVTVVARKVNITGPTFLVEDYQIVNGCQTSHVLYANREKITEQLFVPIKLVYTDDEEVTQEVIKATNRQTPIEENDLLALTRFQKDLETYYEGFLKEKQLYYERRSRQYASSVGVEKTRIVPIVVQLKVFAAMYLGSPHQVGRYQAALLKNTNDSVFKSEHRPEPYYTSALAFYKFESLLRRGIGNSADLRPFKFHFLAAFRYRYEPFEIPSFENKKIAEYCNRLNNILWEIESTREAFDTCADIIRRAAQAANLTLVRDSAKVRDLTDRVRELAIAENPAKAQVQGTPDSAIST
jgi:hypothetical protein